MARRRHAGADLSREVQHAVQIAHAGKGWSENVQYMKKLKHKDWIRQNILRRKRTKANIRKKTRRTRRLIHVSLNSQYHTRRRAGQMKDLIAPACLDFIVNDDETIAFFANLKTYMEKMPVHLDMSAVSGLDVSAILYLISIAQDMKMRHIPFSIRGNLPYCRDTRELLEKSGFFKYARRTSARRFNDAGGNDVLQIMSGSDQDPLAIKAICDFIMNAFEWDRRSSKWLYTIISEVIQNSTNHAYGSRDRKRDSWYISARRTNEHVDLSMLDTGVGIPRTVKRKWYFLGEPLASDFELIRSALEDGTRTETGERHRGKGLPRIYSFYKTGHLEKLVIVSRTGYINGDEGGNLKGDFHGTLFAMRIRNGRNNH